MFSYIRRKYENYKIRKAFKEGKSIMIPPKDFKTETLEEFHKFVQEKYPPVKWHQRRT